MAIPPAQSVRHAVTVPCSVPLEFKCTGRTGKRAMTMPLPLSSSVVIVVVVAATISISSRRNLYMGLVGFIFSQTDCTCWRVLVVEAVEAVNAEAEGGGRGRVGCMTPPSLILVVSREKATRWEEVRGLISRSLGTATIRIRTDADNNNNNLIISSY